MIALRAHTLFKVEKQDYNKDAPGEGSQATELLRGGMRAITGAIGKERPSAVTYRTPVATIGIRGTVLDVIYVPPGGLPGLPGVKPGLYTRVIKGQVQVSNPAGDLMLAAGEIAYVADIHTPPELRPDLSWVFVRYSSISGSGDKDEGTGAGTGDGEGDDSGTGSGGGSGDSGNGGDFPTTIEPQSGGIDNVLTQTAVPQATVKPGPYAMMVTSDGFTTYQGAFIQNVVSVGTGGELTFATGGSGDLSLFDNNGANLLTTPGSTTAGDSTINWGSYDVGQVTVLDSSGNPVPFTSGNLDYIYATQILPTINDLPTTGSFTYSYAGGSGVLLNDTSSLTVDFGSGTMSVNLDYSTWSWTATNQSISNFYNGGISLSNGVYGPGSTINGRFVGTNAEGAISTFELVFDGNLTGTAAFTR
jgi:hypothetical protein